MLAGFIAYLFLCAGSLALLVHAINKSPIIEEPMDTHIPSEDYRELCRIRLRCLERREFAEADAERVCEILGVNPKVDSEARDYCFDLATNGTYVAPTIAGVVKQQAGQ